MVWRFTDELSLMHIIMCSYSVYHHHHHHLSYRTLLALKRTSSKKDIISLILGSVIIRKHTGEHRRNIFEIVKRLLWIWKFSVFNCKYNFSFKKKSKNLSCEVSIKMNLIKDTRQRTWQLLRNVNNYQRKKMVFWTSFYIPSTVDMSSTYLNFNLKKKSSEKSGR